MCQFGYVFGFQSRVNGGMAKYCAYPATARVHHVPKSLSAGEAAYIEPAACAWHAVDRGEIQPGDTVVVCGVGNIGLCMLQIAKMQSVGQLIALDTKDYRLDLARQFGADVAINVAEEDAVQRVKDLTDGYGCDVFIEASGNPAGVTQGLQMIRKLGTFVEFSVFNEPATVNWTVIGDTKELTFTVVTWDRTAIPRPSKQLPMAHSNVKPLSGRDIPGDRFRGGDEASLSGGVLKNLVVPV